MKRSKRILVVDDEVAITSALTALFEQTGYEVSVAASGKQAMTLLAEGPDLIVLDVMMPGVDGYQVCRQVREQAAYIPILMLTARSESWEKVTGLELGADVYLTKPFVPGELLAQVKALLRLADKKSNGTAANLLICEPLHLWLQKRRVERDGEAVDLAPKEFELLYFFMQHPGQVFGRETLLRQVWGYDYAGDSRTVDVHIQRLRRKIEADPAQPELLQTVRGFGYRLVIPDK